MQNNLHLKYIFFNVQQYIDTEWHKLILSTSVYYVNNNPLVKSKVIWVQLCEMILFAYPHPLLLRYGSLVFDVTMRFNESVIVSNVLTVLSDAAR